MNLFVSYTRTDGHVTNDKLFNLNNYLNQYCTPFIHAVQQHRLRWQQFSVIIALLKAHSVLLITSPSAQKSPWVRFELYVARLKGLPIMQIKASDIPLMSTFPATPFHLTTQTLQPTTVFTVEGIKKDNTNE